MRLAPALALAALAVGQSFDPQAYSDGLVRLCQSQNLTTLATLVQSGGPGLASYLAPPANFTFIAPSDRAFDKFLAAVGPLAPNSSMVADTLAYHILQVGIAPGFLTTGDTIVKSSLASTNVTTQARGKALPVVLTAGSGGSQSPLNATSLTVVQALGTIVPVLALSYQNLGIFVVDSVLTVPNVTTAVASTIPGLAALVSAIGLASPSLTTTLNAAHGVTLFAPNSSAFAAIAPLTANGTNNATTILAGHAVLGGSIYSPELAGDDGGSVTSVSGQRLTIISNATGIFIQAGRIVAKIIQPDVITENGVIHIIDRVLFDPTSNTTATPSTSSVLALSTPTITVPGPVLATGTIMPQASVVASPAQQILPRAVGVLGVVLSLFL